LIDQPDLVERQSTMRGHSEDPHVERALQWMREHCAHGIGIESVAKVAGVSVRSLQKRFLRALGRTPLQELKTLRIEQIKRMLRDEDRTLEEIAEACQISSGIYLSQFFKRETGMTPGAYRKIFRSADST
jgi:LacI family transcriptional regulator